jgi:hypothetical protein
MHMANITVIKSLEMYPDYYEVVKEPMDLLTIQRRNDENYYITFDMFLDDLNLVMSNAKLYFNEHNDQHHLLSKVSTLDDENFSYDISRYEL